MRFERSQIAKFLERTDCAWHEAPNGTLVIDGLNGTPKATVQRVVNAYGGQMRSRLLGDTLYDQRVFVISRKE